MRTEKISYSQLKTEIEARLLTSIDVRIRELIYKIIATDKYLAFYCEIEISSIDGLDFKANYIDKKLTNKRQEAPLDSQNVPRMVSSKPTLDSETLVSHNWCDRTTWYQKSVQVIDETIIPILSTYTLSNMNVIDSTHHKIFNEHALTIGGYSIFQGDTPKYKPTIKDGTAILVEDTDFTLNYTTGRITFTGHIVIGVITASYYYATTSEYILEPKANSILNLSTVEINFTTDVTVSSPLHFEIWVGNPSFNALEAISAANPIRVLYDLAVFNNEMDIISSANEGQGTIPKFGNLSSDILVFPFKYESIKMMKSSQLTQIITKIEGDIPLVGSTATSTMYVTHEPEV